MDSWPTPAVSGTTTRFGTVCPGVQLRLDAKGRVLPVGNTVNTPFAVWSTAVTFRTTALTPVVGTPPIPATVTLSVVPAASVCPAFGLLLAARVSLMRLGARGTN